MEERKVFCEECRSDVEFIVEAKQKEGTLKGETYSYVGKVARCTKCNSEIYVDEINDFNLTALYDQYRKVKGIIQLETVLKIPAKYAIGKRPLSLLLGWGELTFSRYCEGDVPTKQYSDILEKIYNDPQYYAQILEDNKMNLKNEFTYKKSKMAVNSILSGVKKEQAKIDKVIEYLLNQCEDITPLALQKALYYIQGFYYAFYESFIFIDDCEAWVHGPVFKDIYLRYREYRFDPIKGNDEFGTFDFTEKEKAVIDSVIKYVCCYSGKVLEEFTHSELPWLNAREYLSETEPSDNIISKDDLGNYFNNIKEKYNMMNPNDIKEYTQTMFQQL